MLETDVVLMKQAISAKDYTHSMVGRLLKELQCMGNANFNFFLCVSIPRDCNRLAHELAALRCVCVEGAEPYVNSFLDHINVIVADEQ